MRARSVVVVLVCGAALLGCQQHGSSGPSVPIAPAETSPESAIRTAIRARLAHNTNLNPDAFDTDVKRVTIDGDRAQADVEFHVKSGSGVMQLTYALAKQNGAWAIVESVPMSSNFSHPQVGQSPAVQRNARTGGDSSIFRTMDNFHGATTSPGQKLPPGHPPVNAPSTPNSAETP